jgi:hypothetical protein
MPAAEDPLDVLLRPPADETPGERQARVEREAEARRVSLAIDASIKAEKAAKRKKRIVKLLLLGQSESGQFSLSFFVFCSHVFAGKSTTLRRRLGYFMVRPVLTLCRIPAAVHAHCVPGRAHPLACRHPAQRCALDSHHPGRHLLLVPVLLSPPASTDRLSPTAHRILVHLLLQHPLSPDVSPPLPPNDPDIDNSDSEYTSLHYHHRNRRSPSPSHYYHTSPSSSFTLAHSSSSIPLSIPLEALRARLHAPLRHLEALLISKLVHQEDSSTTHFSASSPGALDLSEHASSSVSIPGDEHHQPSPTGSCFPHVLTNATNTNNNKELSIRIGPGWRGVLSNARVSPPLDTSTHTLPHSRTGSLDKTKTKDEAQEMMYSLRKDMIQLWHDPSVRDILRRRKIRLEESSGL